MKKLLFLIFFLHSVNGFCQFLPEDMKAGLKGNISYIATTVYSLYTGVSINRDIQVFDKNGRFVQTLIYETTSKATSDFTFQYDKAGRLLSYKQYTGKIMQLKVVNHYSAAGLINLQETYYYTHGYPNAHFDLVKNFYQYNSKRQLIKRHTDQFGVDIRPYSEYYTYDLEGRKVMVLSEGHALANAIKKTFNYNHYGDVVRMIKSNPDDANSYSDTTIYSYSSYDKNGNWRKKKEFDVRDGKKEPDNITVRKITYFK